MKKTTPYFGIDGCRGGWISVQVMAEGEWNVELYSTINDFWDIHSDSKLVLIDMPIGMRDSGKLPRLNDQAGRDYLKVRKSPVSSIFPTPCRAALYVSTYDEANQVNRECTGKGLSKQSWNICPKIRELDKFLQKNRKSIDIFIESGPELCFLNFNKGNGGHGVEKSNTGNERIHSKKTKEGVSQRISILSKYFKITQNELDEILVDIGKKNATIDDILDALILALSASKGKGGIDILPKEFEYDSKGLPMRMAIPSFIDRTYRCYSFS